MSQDFPDCRHPAGPPLRLRLNGEWVELARPCCLAALLSARALDEAGTAVALNGEVVARSIWGETALSQHDAVDVFRVIAGG